MSVIAEATSDNLLTIDAFNEMLEFNRVIESIEERSDATIDKDNNIVRANLGRVVKFSDICKQL